MVSWELTTSLEADFCLQASEKVGKHPRGGFKMSGNNAKADGHDYLRLFLEMKSVAEHL